MMHPRTLGLLATFILAWSNITTAKAEMPRPDVCDIEVWVDADFGGPHWRTQDAAVPFIAKVAGPEFHDSISSVKVYKGIWILHVDVGDSNGVPNRDPGQFELFTVGNYRTVKINDQFDSMQCLTAFDYFK